MYKKFEDFKSRKVMTFLVGCPASGKSTWVEENKKNSLIISRDDIVDDFRGTGMSYSDTFNDYKFQKRVNAELEERINFSLNSNKNVIVDMTNMSIKSRSKILNKPQTKDFYKKAIVFNVNKQTILNRLKKREKETGKVVGVDVVDKMLNSYEEPTKKEGFDDVIFINQ